MCNTCGCNVTDGNRHLLSIPHQQKSVTAITVLSNLLKHNDQQADQNRASIESHGVLAINLMSSPGSGKTALLEATIQKLKHKLSIAVIEGDLETENDADRIRAQGVQAYQITTGTACHLDAHLIQQALTHIRLDEIDVLFIENVGNLVCPASFDLGHHRNVTLLSVTEGDDKPAKYPVMFRASDVMLITKTDLLPYLGDFSVEKAIRYQHELASQAPVLALSSRSGEGFDAWLQWLEQEVSQHKIRIQQQQSIKPTIQAEGQQLHQQEPVRFRPVARA
ncbi:MAG: hydrogenase nickel incorporation protein HypB [Methylovulum sp.]|jgi:hydrogenase nickel incorporation protein HypB|nr:hydrogenase nickel incorporation protein HypB [Methylovulum sp.]MCF7997757.1 hydrogenase nickel incorporation protein HypB [Methylovulum sp.]